MPSNLRKRKGQSDSQQLPSSASNPKPDTDDSGHVAISRRGPTIMPTVFILLIVGLLLVLPPVFYFTQVMIPDSESTSILSQFRRKGNLLLNALGHASSSGQGHMPFSPQIPKSEIHQSPHVEPANQKEKKAAVDSTKELRQLSKPEHENQPIIDKESTISKQKQNEEDSTPKGSPIILKSSPTIVSSMEELKKLEKQRKLEEDLGKFWEASSRYRKQAQKEKAGEYSLQGDGTTDEGSSEDKPSNPEGGLLDDLPPADPDAKEGLTPEFWEAIKDQLSADDLTVVLNKMRLKEQEAAATTKS